MGGLLFALCNPKPQQPAEAMMNVAYYHGYKKVPCLLHTLYPHGHTHTHTHTQAHTHIHKHTQSAGEKNTCNHQKRRTHWLPMETGRKVNQPWGSTVGASISLPAGMCPRKKNRTSWTKTPESTVHLQCCVCVCVCESVCVCEIERGRDREREG